jgi:hypothetical protein
MEGLGFALDVSFYSSHCCTIELTPGTEDFAITETLYTIVHLVQTFERLEYAGTETLQPLGEEQQNLGMVLVSTDGCWVDLRR